MTREESEQIINHFQAFLIMDGQIDIDPDEAIRNRDIFLNNYLASDGVLADVIVPKGTVCGYCGCDSYTRGLRRKEICQRCGEDWPQTAL